MPFPQEPVQSQSDSSPTPPSLRLVGKVRYRKRVVSVVGLAAFVIFSVAGGLSIGREWSLYGFDDWQTYPGIWLGGAILLLMSCHELLHGLASIGFGGLKWSQVKFGISLKGLLIYCHPTEPMSVRAYRTVLMLPLYVTGAGCLLLLLWIRQSWLAFIWGMAIGMSVGDVWTWAKLLRWDDTLLAQDSQLEPGCDIYASEKAETLKS
ncbi:MAG: DUF3267 domain-containing protein [Verrucomicrobiota bacterium]